MYLVVAAALFVVLFVFLLGRRGFHGGGALTGFIVASATPGACKPGEDVASRLRAAPTPTRVVSLGNRGDGPLTELAGAEGYARLAGVIRARFAVDRLLS